MAAAPAEAVLYTNKEVAADGMVVISVLPVRATLGINNPLLVAATSSLALALGVVVPMPTDWANPIILVMISNAEIINAFFMLMICND